MAGERKKSSDIAGQISAKGSKKLLSKTYKPTSATISSPPKAAVAAPNAKKEEGHRRRNPLNELLRRRSGDGVVDGKDDSPQPDTEPVNASRSNEKASKDDAQLIAKVSELERALNTAREEQDALRQELEDARQQHRPDTRDMADERRQSDQTFEDVPRDSGNLTREDSGEVEHSNSISDVEISSGAAENRRHRLALDQSHDDTIQLNYELRFKLAQLQDQLTSQRVIHRNELDRAFSHEDTELNALRTRLHATEKESQERLQQLFALKSSISSLTRSESQVTDSDLTDSFSQLSNRIREWVVSNFRRTKLNTVNLSPETIKALRSLTPTYESIEQTDRLPLYQALLSSALMQIFEEPIIVGLPHSGVLAAIRPFARSLQNSGSEYCEWRRATVRVLEKSEAEKALEEGRSELLYRIAGEIAHILFAVTSVTLTPVAQSSLMGILNAAADLQRTLVLQRARYQVIFLRNQDANTMIGFDDQKMEFVNDPDSIDEDDDVPMQRQFLFCVFPYLEKYGNEWGENVELGNILLRARVCCGVG